MTDAQGRRARWTAALVVAPSAAAVFGASVSWAAHTRPATLGKTTPTAAPATAATRAAPASGAHVGATIEAEAVALKRTLAADARRTAKLRRHLAAAHKELADLKKLAQRSAPVASGGGTVTVSQSGPGVLGSAPGPVAIQAPPPAAAPAAAPPPPAAAPPPPPPVQVVTGASGAVK